MKQYCICNPVNRVFDKKGNCSLCGKSIKRTNIRKKWYRKPQIQIKKSDKLYNRKKAKHKLKKRLKEE